MPPLWRPAMLLEVQCVHCLPGGIYLIAGLEEDMAIKHLVLFEI